MVLGPRFFVVMPNRDLLIAWPRGGPGAAFATPAAPQCRTRPYPRFREVFVVEGRAVAPTARGARGIERP